MDGRGQLDRDTARAMALVVTASEYHPARLCSIIFYSLARLTRSLIKSEREVIKPDFVRLLFGLDEEVLVAYSWGVNSTRQGRHLVWI